jgi:hypothetical protein
MATFTLHHVKHNSELLHYLLVKDTSLDNPIRVIYASSQHMVSELVLQMQIKVAL